MAYMPPSADILTVMGPKLQSPWGIAPGHLGLTPSVNRRRLCDYINVVNIYD